MSPKIHIPIVSVLMTSFNREKYIAEAIESVLASTFEDFELIIVDDCSTDRTVEIARSYVVKDNRIKLFINEENLGDYPNRNKAASYAIGKYIKYLDADDLIYPFGLKVMVDSIAKFPGAALGIQSKKKEDKYPYPILSNPHESYMKHFLLGGLLTSGPTGTIINREIFHNEGGFSGKAFIGDTELWLKLSAKHPIVKFQPALIWWRQHSDQQMNLEKRSFESSFARYILDINAIRSILCPLDLVTKKKALWKINKMFILEILSQPNSFLSIHEKLKYLLKLKFK